jgi:hypothetical protein
MAARQMEMDILDGSLQMNIAFFGKDQDYHYHPATNTSMNHYSPKAPHTSPLYNSYYTTNNFSTK